MGERPQYGADDGAECWGGDVRGCHQRPGDRLPAGLFSRHQTSFLRTEPRGEGAKLGLGLGPSSSDINFLPRVLRKPLASLHLIRGSDLAMGLRAGISALQPHGLAGLRSHRLTGPRGCRPLHHLPPLGRVKAWCWEKGRKKTF